MSFLSCECRNNYTGLALVTSLIIGVITAFLQITGVIAVTPVFLWVVLGIAVVYLAVTLIAVSTGQTAGTNCICCTVTALLAGILGTVLFAIILLAVTFAATSVVGAIFVGLLLFFFSLTITATAALVRCFARCNN